MMTETSVPAIRVSGLCKNFGAHKAVAGIDFTVNKGEVVGFLGPNGAGKSTTMRILAGLQPATSGTAEICGVSVSREPFKTKSFLGYMPENNPLPTDLRVSEYLRFRARLKDVPAHKLYKRVEEVMAACDLARTARHKLIGSLSKGFRQRVGIADALLSEPEVIILDEPTIGLDPHQILGIRKLISSLRGEKAVLISSHILPEIENVCDRVIIINQGVVVANGTPDELRDEFLKTREFVVSADVPAERLAEISGVPAESVSRNEHGQFVIAFPAGTVCGGLLARLQDGGVPVSEFYEKRASLEDVFLAATRRVYDTVSVMK